MPVQRLADTTWPGGSVQKVAPEIVMVLGKAGTIPAATAQDQADFIIVVPFNATLKRLKLSVLTKPSADTTLQLRRSTDSGNSWSDVANYNVTITTAGTAKVASNTPGSTFDVSEGDCLGFSITAGGGTGTNAAFFIIAQAR